MRNKILGLVAVGLLAGPMAAHAVTLSAGDKAYFGFSLPPASSYFLILFTFADYGLGDSVGFDIYGDSGLVGLQPESRAYPIRPASRAYNYPEVIDGNFLYGIEALSGSFDVSICAETDSFLQGPCAPPARTWINQNPVPEPGTLALLGLGLAGLGLSRRRIAA